MKTNDKSTKSTNKINVIFNNNKFINGLLLVIFTAILFFITIKNYESSKLDIIVGDIAEVDIRATRQITDQYTTEKLKSEAMNKVTPKYRISPSVQMNMKDAITTFIDTTRDIKLQSNLNTSRKADVLAESTNLNLERAHLITALNMDFKSLNNFENIMIDLINQLMGRGVKEEELEYELENLKETFSTLNLTNEQQSLGLSLIYDTIQPNEFIDRTETDKLMREQAEKIQPVIIQQNDLIIQKGNIISKQIFDLIKESGLLKEDNKTPLTTIFGMGLILILGILIVALYIYLFNRKIFYSNKLLMILLITVLNILIAQGFYVISPYLMPIAAGAILIAILLEPRLAIVLNIFVVSYLGFLYKLDTNIIAMYILSTSLGVLSFTKQNQRYSILLNGLYIGVINIIIITSFSMIQGTEWKEVFSKGSFTIVNGIMSGIIALGSLPIWENIFSILTPLKLLELSNPNQPLLKKLLLEAPGTYHHSLMVGNLSEAAAEEIGANPLLARAGAYYHDIGKSRKPYFFKENQFGMENPHDKLEPLQSTNIITGHITDGLRMAKDGRLPKEISDIIEQHHGDTLVAYFYHKSKEEGMDIDESEFRYKGSRPQSKESAIVMLADSVEAAVRSLKEHSRESIESMVTKIIKSKLHDGQLDECDITNKEISLIINTFVNVLVGIYHERIEYPKMELSMEESN